MSIRGWLDLDRGVVVLGTVTVPCAAVGSDGDVCVDDGVVLRPVSFEVRTQAAWRAGLEPDPAAALAASLLALQTVGPAPVRAYDEVVSLVLAGAGDEGGSFAETLTTAMEETGLAAEELQSVPACRVDEAARQAAGRDRGVGWKTIVFADPHRDVDWTQLRDEFASRLLRRVREHSDLRDLEAEDAVGASDARPVVERVEARSARASALATRRDPGAPLEPAPIGTDKEIALPISAPRVRLVGASVAPPGAEARRAMPNRIPQLRRASLDGARSRTSSALSSAPDERRASADSSPVAAALAPAASARSLATSVTHGAPRSVLAPSQSTFGPLAAADARTGVPAIAAASARFQSVTHRGLDLSIAHATSHGSDEGAAGDLADLIADLLNREADLRGID